MKGGGWRRETRDQSRNQEARGLGPQISQISADFFWGREGSYPLSVISDEGAIHGLWILLGEGGERRTSNAERGVGSGGWGAD